VKPEQQRIAIAEACGIVSRDHWGPLYKTPQGAVRDCPDYLNDLNAMHEAEKVFLKMETLCFWETYSNRLTSSLGWIDIFHATAAQRAEAFLRTIGKWEDDK
jgi:hypothetical protein